MIQVKKWWLGRRIIGKRVFMEKEPDDPAQALAAHWGMIDKEFVNAGKVKDIDWWDMDVYTDNGWVGGYAYITFCTFIQALFSKPAYERKPWKELD